MEGANLQDPADWLDPELLFVGVDVANYGFGRSSSAAKKAEADFKIALALLLHLRTDNVISDLILVDPVGPGFTSAEWARQIRATIAVGANDQS